MLVLLAACVGVGLMFAVVAAIVVCVVGGVGLFGSAGVLGTAGLGAAGAVGGGAGAVSFFRRKKGVSKSVPVKSKLDMSHETMLTRSSSKVYPIGKQKAKISFFESETDTSVSKRAPKKKPQTKKQFSKDDSKPLSPVQEKSFPPV